MVPFAAQVHQGGVARDLPQPGPQPLRLAQFVKLPPGYKEGLLRRVFAGREIPQNAQGNAADHGLVAGDNLHKGPLVAPTRGADQLGIRQGCALPKFVWCVRFHAPIARGS